MRNILYSWPHQDVQAFFQNDLGIPLKIEDTGKMFPQSDRSRDVVDALLRELKRSGAVLRPSTRITGVERVEGGVFRLTGGDGQTLETSKLVLSTGGLSIPKSGSDGGGYDIAKSLGHSCLPTYPALVPLLTTEPRWTELSGLSVVVGIDVWEDGKRVETREGDFLFTHRGFSGPVILDISRYATREGGDVSFRVHWGGKGVNWDTVLSQPGRSTVGSVCRRILPDRLAGALVTLAGADSTLKLSELRRDVRKMLIETLETFELPVGGSEGYKTAEVTGGGIPLSEVVPATLESRLVPGLYICGEMLDATGGLGGFNFLWAWVTGRKVGRAIGASINAATQTTD